MARTGAQERAAVVARLGRLRDEGALSSEHVRVVAASLGVAERTVWRWISAPSPAQRRPQSSYRLTDIDREAFAFYRGNVAALARARQTVLDCTGQTAGADVPDFLAEGWRDARPVALRTLQRAFADQLTTAERAAWRVGESGQRAAQVYLRRTDAPRGRVWEMDHKQLPLLVLPPRGGALSPWLTTVVDDGCRGLLGWALSVHPSAGTVLTAMRMAMAYEPETSPFGSVPERVRVDRGLEFAAEAVEAALGTLAVVAHRLPPNRPTLRTRPPPLPGLLRPRRRHHMPQTPIQARHVGQGLRICRRRGGTSLGRRPGTTS
ncbi:integrase catalytic domain-containing protein [Kitasatospora herbaricolor]|uniref:integrase catalytic domain-containing protein n=1 Tax=Kitasatospora herbaricolor TaxID=68217 RepID=UPI0039A6F02D